VSASLPMQRWAVFSNTRATLASPIRVLLHESFVLVDQVEFSVSRDCGNEGMDLVTLVTRQCCWAWSNARRGKMGTFSNWIRRHPGLLVLLAAVIVGQVLQRLVQPSLQGSPLVGQVPVVPAGALGAAVVLGLVIVWLRVRLGHQLAAAARERNVSLPESASLPKGYEVRDPPGQIVGGGLGVVDLVLLLVVQSTLRGPTLALSSAYFVPRNWVEVGFVAVVVLIALLMLVKLYRTAGPVLVPVAWWGLDRVVPTAGFLGARPALATGVPASLPRAPAAVASAPGAVASAQVASGASASGPDAAVASREMEPTVAAATRSELEATVAAPTGSGLEPSVAAATRSELEPRVAAPTPAGLGPTVAAATRSDSGPSVSAVTGSQLEPTVAAPAPAGLVPSVGAATHPELEPTVVAPTASRLEPAVAAATASGLEPSVSAATRSESEPGTAAATRSELEPSAAAATRPESEPSVGAATRSELEPSTAAATRAESEPNIAAATRSELEPSAAAATRPDSEPGTAAATRSELEPSAAAATRPESEPNIAAATRAELELTMAAPSASTQPQNTPEAQQTVVTRRAVDDEATVLRPETP
jgi:hypothetical protein